MNTPYIVVSNSRLRDKVPNDFVSAPELTYSVDHIKCQHILLCIDSCHSGMFHRAIEQSITLGSRAMADGEERELDDVLSSLYPYRSRKLLTSSGGKETVWDGDYHSPFATAFLSELRDRGGKRKYISFSDLATAMEHIRSGEDTAPIGGDFGSSEPRSQFLFMVKSKTEGSPPT